MMKHEFRKPPTLAAKITIVVSQIVIFVVVGVLGVLAVAETLHNAPEEGLAIGQWVMEIAIAAVLIYVEYAVILAMIEILRTPAAPPEKRPPE